MHITKSHLRGILPLSSNLFSRKYISKLGTSG